MKDFILDLTYKDATIINSNDDIFTIPSNSLSNSSVTYNTINLSKTFSNNNSHNKNNKFNIYNFIDYL